MIAAATNLSSGKMLFNWFDVALVLVLLFGFWRGRKHGMSREFLKVSTWLVTVTTAGLGHVWLGTLLIQQGIIKSVFGKSFTEKTAAYITAYLLITMVVWLIYYMFIGRLFKKKIEGSNAFGSSEYYLGITAGVVRWSCIAVFFLALLHAPVYSSEDIAAKQAYRNRWYGGGLKEFKGDFIPTMDELQAAVFKDSLLGPYINDGINVLLINSAPPSRQKAPSEYIGK
jgi:uncharacterized membrane protein required for colicin V production